MESAVEETKVCHRLESGKDEILTNVSIDEEMMEPIHSKISKGFIPRVGMEFETEDEAYEFYNAYALAVGFSVRKSKSHSYKGIMLDRVFVCSSEGKRARDKRDDIYKSHRAETRCGCLAMMKISCRQRDKYCVMGFTAEHNHYLGNSRTHLFRSHRRMSMSQASEVIDMADISVATPRGHDYLGFAGLDCRNNLHSKRGLEMKSGDTSDVLAYLQHMQVEDPNFFYAIQVDEDDRITNIFWADAKMMVDYEDFGDVVCFDTTYRKHEDGRPIALFVGVNHHRRATIFGAVLLYDDSLETYVWLFDTFSRAMGGKRPKTMLTDEDDAMSKALALQWPETCHRLCIWHLFHNATVHLCSVIARYKDFPRDFSNCIYVYEHEEDFLDAWSEMLRKYELQNNAWLKRMFSIKEKWALVYGRDTFCADIAITQRSESLIKLIRHYVSYNHSLRIFFENFERLVNDRRHDEMVADSKDNQDKSASCFPIAIFKHASSVYTLEIFKLFQEEACKGYDSHLEVCGEMGALLQYKVTPFKKTCSYVVCYDGAQETVCCSCRRFEFAGLLCSHILKVFSFRGITEVPSKYILKRWTRNAKRESIRATCEISNVDGDPKTTIGRRYKELCRLSTRLFTRAAESEDGYNLVKQGLLNLLRECDSRHIVPSHVAQESPIVQLNGSAGQQSAGFTHPWDQSGDNYSTPSAFGQGSA